MLRLRVGLIIQVCIPVIELSGNSGVRLSGYPKWTLPFRLHAPTQSQLDLSGMHSGDRVIRKSGFQVNRLSGINASSSIACSDSESAWSFRYIIRLYCYPNIWLSWLNHSPTMAGSSLLVHSGTHFGYTVVRLSCYLFIRKTIAFQRHTYTKGWLDLSGIHYGYLYSYTETSITTS